MSETVHIRPETPADYAAVFALNQAAFKGDGEALLVDALRKNADVFIPALSLLAETDGKLAGHILFTKIHIEDEAGNRYPTLALAPMAVWPGQQNRGIGSRLVQHGLTLAKESGYTSVIVLGHADYYPKFGFMPADRWGIRAPFDVPASAFMAIELTENALKNIRGTVRYPQEFDGV